MCEPVTLGVLTTALTAGGAASGALGASAAALTAAQTATLALAAGSSVMSAAGMYQQGQVQKQVAANNAVMSEYAAQDAQRRGEEEAAAIQRKAAGLKGTQRAMLAARGIDLGTGTAAEILDQTDFFGETDAATARGNAARDAWAYRAQGQDMRAQGRFAARNANTQAFSTLLGTAGSVADRWNTYTTPRPSRPGGP